MLCWALVMAVDDDAQYTVVGIYIYIFYTEIGCLYRDVGDVTVSRDR